MEQFGVSRRVLDGPSGFIIKDFLLHRLQPTILQRWDDEMPEEAKDHRRFGIVKKGKSAVVRVSFTVHKDGAINNIAIFGSSGDKLLDAAALKAVQNSAPLPLPKAFPEDSLTLRCSFYYNPKR